MKIAELFVNLGLKGSDSALKGATQVRDALGDISTTGLAAKAAVLAVVYAIERMTSAAGENGAALGNFGVLTGDSTVALQQWREAFRRANVEATEADVNFKNIQSTMADFRLLQGANKWFGLVGIDPQRIKDTTHVLDKLREFIKLNHDKDPGAVNKIARSFGLTDSFLITAIKTKEDIYKIRNNILGDGEIAQLEKIKRSWSDFWKSLEMMRDRFVAKHGGSLLGTLNNDVKAVEGMISGLRSLHGEIPALTNSLTLLAGGLAAYFAPVTAGAVATLKLLSELEKHKEGKESWFTGLSVYDAEKGGIMEFLGNMTNYQTLKKAGDGWLGQLISPVSGAAVTASEIQINFNIQGTNPEEGIVRAAKEGAKIIKEAYGSSGARSQVK